VIFFLHNNNNKFIYVAPAGQKPPEPANRRPATTQHHQPPATTTIVVKKNWSFFLFFSLVSFLWWTGKKESQKAKDTNKNVIGSESNGTKTNRLKQTIFNFNGVMLGRWANLPGFILEIFHAKAVRKLLVLALIIWY
jgi:hypothetical protein